MAQHDYSIANQTAANLRTDLNNVLAAIVSNNSGATAPTDTFANMFWYDTSANILKMRNEADDAWISLGYLDQTADALRILDDTQVVNTSGTQTGLLGDQDTATWEAGVGTTESLVSPAKVKAAIDSLGQLGGFKGVQVFTSSGTWTRPTGVNNVLVFVTGGGGGSTDPNYTGGSGGTAIKRLDVTGIASATITIGSGGNTFPSATNGGNSSWADGTNTITGSGGAGISSSFLASGGSGSGGDVNISGAGGYISPSVTFWGANYGRGNASGAGNSGIVVVFEFS